MKYLLLILTMTLVTGCFNYDPEWNATVTSDLKLKAGQEVKVLTGFYAKCNGVISGYSNIKYKNEPHDYKIELWCPELGWLDEAVYLSESNLEVVKDEDEI